eukprot:scaffold63821_cov41-Tisochrysis_lutea.AAC.3
MELPDPIQNFIYPSPGGEEGQSAALAAGAARDGVAESPPATLDSTGRGGDTSTTNYGRMIVDTIYANNSVFAHNPESSELLPSYFKVSSISFCLKLFEWWVY